MDPALNLRREISREQMRIEISEQKNDLEEEQADDPDGGGASEPRQYDFRDERLDLKQKKGAYKNCEAVD